MLSLDDVHVHIGKLHILQGVTLTVKAGECAALLGRNGVGKTTTLRAIMGLARKSAGKVDFEGFDLDNCEPHEIPRRGLGYVPQGRGIFPNLTVLENLCIGLPGRSDPEREEYVFGCFPRLKERLRQSGSTLSGGEQQMLAIARALVQSPRLLLIDEMSMGLAPIAVESLMPVIRQVADEHGASVIMVEQHVHLALEVADEAMVMVHGSVVLSGPAKVLRDDTSAVESAYMSGSVTSG